MADVTIAVASGVADGTTNNQTFTTADLGGAVPKAALIVTSEGFTDGVYRNAKAITFSATDGTNVFSESSGSQNKTTGNTDTNLRSRTDNLIFHIFPQSSAAKGSANFVQFVANVIEIDWLNALEDSRRMSFLFFAGNDVQAKVGTVALGAVDVAVDVSTIGFEPDIVLVCWDRDNFSGAGVSNLTMSLGAVHNDGAGTVTQRCQAMRSRHNVATSALSGQVRNDYAQAEVDNNGNIVWGAEFGAFDAQGFSVTPRIGAGGTIAYMALKFTGMETWVGDTPTPTATGDDAQTGPGFKPDFVATFINHFPQFNTAYTDDNAGVMGLSLVTSAAQESNVTTEQDNVVANTGGVNSSVAIDAYNPAKTQSFKATFKSFDNQGWTYNYTTVDTTIRRWFGFAVGSNAVTLKSAADTLDSSVAETTAMLASMARTDVADLGLSETTVTLGNLARTDSLDASVADVTLLTVIVDVTDTLSVSITEAQAALTAALQVSDAIDTAITGAVVQLSAVIQVSDTLDATITDAVSQVLALLNRGDTLDTSLTEQVQGVLAELSRADTLDAGIGDNAALLALQSSVDTLNASVGDAVAQLSAVMQAGDTIDTAVSDAVTAALALLNRSDSLSASLSEQVQGIATRLSRADALDAALSDSAAILTAINLGDTLDISAADITTLLRAVIQAGDTVDTSISEAVSQVAARLSRTDALDAAVSGQVQAISAVLNAADSLDIDAVGAAQLLAAMQMADSLSIDVSEVRVLVALLDASDGLDVTVTETSLLNSVAFGRILGAVTVKPSVTSTQDIKPSIDGAATMKPAVDGKPEINDG